MAKYYGRGRNFERGVRFFADRLRRDGSSDLAGKVGWRSLKLSACEFEFHLPIFALSTPTRRSGGLLGLAVQGLRDGRELRLPKRALPVRGHG